MILPGCEPMERGAYSSGNAEIYGVTGESVGQVVELVKMQREIFCQEESS